MVLSTILLVCFNSLGQTYKYYPEFDRYGSWSFGGSYYFVKKESINRIYGDYTIDPLYPSGYSFSVRKTFNKSGQFSIVTGLTMYIYNEKKFKYRIKSEDIQSSGFTEDWEDIVSGNLTRRTNFSIPVLIQYKSKLADNIFFSGQAGIETMYKDDGISESLINFVDERGKRTPVMYYELENISRSNLYPNMVLSPGVYFMFKHFMLQTNLVYSKSLKNQYNGFLYFFNLDQSGNTLIKTKKTGDYLGLSVNIFFKSYHYPR